MYLKQRKTSSGWSTIMPFCKGGRHIWPHFSQAFSGKDEEFLWSSDRKFPEFFKTHPTFVSSPLLVPSMARQTLNCVFFWDLIENLQQKTFCRLLIKDEMGRPVFRIEGPCWTGSCCGSDVEFKVLCLEKDEQVHIFISMHDHLWLTLGLWSKRLVRSPSSAQWGSQIVRTH